MKNLVGNTPVYFLGGINTNDISLKMEYLNPTGSIKDRPALEMLRHAIFSGELNGRTVIEASSGNTGISLAWAGAMLGIRVVIVMSKGVTKERVKMIEAFGAKVIFSPKREFTDGAIRKVKEIIKKHPKKYYYINQFSNPNNPKAQEEVAKEIFEDLSKVDYIVAPLGSSGTLMGIANYIQKNKLKTKIVAAHMEKNSLIPGLKNMSKSIKPKIYSRKKIHKTFFISSEEAKEKKEYLARNGFFVGHSSGAAFAAASKLAQKVMFKNIVVILPDRGERYLSEK